MKESETMKEYFDKLLKIANKVRLLGSEFRDSKLVENILGTILEMFEATISSLGSSKDLSKISLAALINALQEQEQKTLMRSERESDTSIVPKVKIGNGEYIGFSVVFESNQYVIKDANDNDVFKVQTKGKSFALVPLEEEQAAFPLAELHTEVLHKSKACQLGKQSRFPFKQSTWRAIEKLQLNHKDMDGPHNTPSLNGNRVGKFINLMRSQESLKVYVEQFLEEEIYVEQPEGFAVKGQEDDVYLLKKALYGLR
ncbi:hypothetical protein Sango_3029700 [Sesamum angolense]|uniref:Uncharacterized protein n=1 Tax=Sesamum angolense TaxID=2727404 RepID=A0AAE1T3C0_9LAMI|nr:hypothetical protein Sango_3029700 [Sesamum angolense]